MSQQQSSQSQNSPITASAISNTNPTIIANNDGNLLFACTKCNSRHKFEDLSRRHQLCRACKSSYEVVSCDFCRNEFKQEVGSRPSSICKKCEELQEQYGKPNVCSCCNIKAAFIGTKCQRCNNSEKKYGPPLTCENCHQKCAFDRPDADSKAKVDGKMLCWLCTMSYKRNKANARQKHDSNMIKSSRHHNSSLKGTASDNKDTNNYHSYANNHRQHRHHRSPNGASNHKANTSLSTGHHHRSSQSSHKRPSSHHQKESSSIPSSDITGLKRPRLNHNSNLTNGHLSLTHTIPGLADSHSKTDSNGSEMAAVISQLKDQMAALNKRLSQKEKELLSKDQHVSILNFHLYLKRNAQF